MCRGVFSSCEPLLRLKDASDARAWRSSEYQSCESRQQVNEEPHAGRDWSVFVYDSAWCSTSLWKLDIYKYIREKDHFDVSEQHCSWFNCVCFMSVNTSPHPIPSQFWGCLWKAIYCVWWWNQSAVIYNEVMEATVNSQINISPWTINKFLRETLRRSMCSWRDSEGCASRTHTHADGTAQHMPECSAHPDICPLCKMFMLD